MMDHKEKLAVVKLDYLSKAVIQAINNDFLRLFQNTN